MYKNRGDIIKNTYVNNYPFKIFRVFAKNVLRMTLWESARTLPPKEQVPKKPLEQISQVDGTTMGRASGELVLS